MMLVVADASVLIHLSRIGRFRLLESLYERVVICPGVYAEVVERGWRLPGSIETEGAVNEGWMRVVDVADKRKARRTAKEQGIQMANAETIQLALEIKPSLLLANEEVRSLAEEAGLKIRGCLGILIEGARKRLTSVPEARRGVEELRASGYRVSDEILKAFYSILEGLEER